MDETIPATLYGDDVNISHIIMNLGSNAIKYTREGTITLTVTWEPQGEDGSLVIHMEDTGVGIRQEDLPYIFKAMAGWTAKPTGTLRAPAWACPSASS